MTDKFDDKKAFWFIIKVFTYFSLLFFAYWTYMGMNFGSHFRKEMELYFKQSNSEFERVNKEAQELHDYVGKIQTGVAFEMDDWRKKKVVTHR